MTPLGRIRLTDDYMKRGMAMAVPGARFERDEDKHYIVDDPSPRAAAVICRLFPHLTDEYPELTVLRDGLLRDARPFDNATAAGLTPHCPSVLAVVAASPCVRCAALPDGPDPDCAVCHGNPEVGGMFPFQRVDLGYIAAVLRKHGSAEVAWERGLGKTLAACALIEHTAASRVLVVAPNTAKGSVWEDEVRRFLDFDNVFVMPNGQPKRREKLLQHVATTHDPLVLITHYESLDLVGSARKDGHGWDRLGTWDIIVADESHRLANTKTKTHRALMKVPTTMKLSLTGSMIQNHPEEMYGRLRWMFPNTYKSKWRDWNLRYLDYVESGYGKVLVGPKIDRVDEMRQELGVFTVYRRKSDELDLPPKQEQVVRVDLTPAQRTAYNDLRDSFVAVLDSGDPIIALQPVVLLTRLRQVASGLDLFSREVAESAKMDWTVDRVRGNPDGAFVIFTWYKEAALAIAARLREDGESVQVVTGDTTHKQRRERIAAFQRGDGGRVFVGTIATLGESVNLHRANEGIFIDQSWNPAQNEQASDRYYRIGQTRPTITTKLVAKDTVDEYNVLPALNNKESIRRMILGGL